MLKVAWIHEVGGRVAASVADVLFDGLVILVAGEPVPGIGFQHGVVTLRAVPLDDARILVIHAERIAPESDFDAVSARDFGEAGEFVRELDFVDFPHEGGEPAVVDENDVDSGLCRGVKLFGDRLFGDAEGEVGPGVREDFGRGAFGIIGIAFEPVTLESEIAGQSEDDAVCAARFPLAEVVEAEPEHFDGVGFRTVKEVVFARDGLGVGHGPLLVEEHAVSGEVCAGVLARFRGSLDHAVVRLVAARIEVDDFGVVRIRMEPRIDERGVADGRQVGLRLERVVPAQRGGVLPEETVPGQSDGTVFPGEVPALRSLIRADEFVIRKHFAVGDELRGSGGEHVLSGLEVREGVNAEERFKLHADFNK